MKSLLNERNQVGIIERFARTQSTGDRPAHPFFGVLTRPQWGLLQWRHTDHHLRQFGV